MRFQKNEQKKTESNGKYRERKEIEMIFFSIFKQVFFDITIGGEKAGRVVIGLFSGTVPKTARNFKELAENTVVGEG